MVARRVVQVAHQVPRRGPRFDYSVEADAANPHARRLVHWRERLPSYSHVANTSLNAIVVPTVDTTRLTFLIDMVSCVGKPVAQRPTPAR